MNQGMAATKVETGAISNEVYFAESDSTVHTFMNHLIETDGDFTGADTLRKRMITGIGGVLDFDAEAATL